MKKGLRITDINILSSFKYSDEVYKNILKQYIRTNEGKGEIDLLQELIDITNSKLQLYENNSEQQIRQILLEENKNIKGKIDNKLESFILNKKIDINSVINQCKEDLLDFNIKISRLSKVTEKESILNFNDSKGTEKIIFLQKLGVIDYLKTLEPFKASTNALASAISGFTGVDAKTVQSYINPINNPTVSQKNNPLLSLKSVNKVVQKLNNLGYNTHI